MALKLSLVGILVAIVIQVQCQATANVKDTGILLRINQGGADVLKDLAFDLAEALGKDQAIAPVNTTFHFGFGIPLECRLANTTMTSLKFNGRSLVLSEPNIFYLTSYDSQLTLEGEWDTKLGSSYQRNGLFTATMNNIRTSLTLKSGLVDGGPIELRDASCGFIPDDFVSNITKINGSSAANISQEYIRKFALPAQKEATKQDSCDVFIPSAVNQVNSLFNRVPDSYEVLSGIHMDLDITEEPNVVCLNSTKKVFEIGISGAMASTDNFTLGTSPAVPALPAFTESNSSAQAIISEQVINTLLQSVYETAFTFTFGGDQVSLVAGFTLGPIIALFVPPFAPYQNDPLLISIRASRPPTFNVTNGSIAIQGGFIVSLNVGNATNHFTAFSLIAELNATGVIIGNNNKLSARIDDLEIDFALESNNLNTSIDVSSFVAILHASISIIKTQVNDLLAAGIKLPEFFSLSFSNIVINMKQSALEVIGDVATSFDFAGFDFFG